MARSALALLLALATVLTTAGQERVPRPEYPQPQFQRADWLTLNGPWQFEFDDDDAGLDGNWASGSKAFTRTITVPFPFESKLSGIGDT